MTGSPTGEAGAPNLPTLVNALLCARLAISRLDVGAMGWIREPHPLFGLNMVPVTEELLGIIDRALPASAIEAATAGETTKIGSTEGESAVGAAETPKGQHHGR